MAAKTSTFSILLLVSLLSLFATKSVARNRLSIPSSCVGHPGLLKCALDFESALKAAASSKIHISASALSVALDLISAARAAGISIKHFLSSIHGGLTHKRASIEWVTKLNSTINVAEHELIKASTVISSEKKLSLTALHNVEESLKIAAEIAAKLNVGVGLEHTNSDTNVLLNNLIKQFNSLTNLSLKIIGTIEANAKSSF